MEITAGLVKELREKTGVGMMECKQAIVESGGNMDKAILYLRERGMARAQKKADRAASEGMVVVEVADDATVGVLVEVNCETDFVSSNEDFRSFAAKLGKMALRHQEGTIEGLAKRPFEGGLSVQDTVVSLVAKIGENIQLRRVAMLKCADGVVGGYSHLGGKIGTLVALRGGQSAEAKSLAKELAMQVAAASPRYTTPDQVDKSELEQEKELARKKLLQEGKDPQMVEKILTGQMQKFFKEVCLLEQPYIKDPKMSVKQLLDKSGQKLTLVSFQRFQLGEGVEKKAED